MHPIPWAGQLIVNTLMMVVLVSKSLPYIFLNLAVGNTLEWYLGISSSITCISTKAWAVISFSVLEILGLSVVMVEWPWYVNPLPNTWSWDLQAVSCNLCIERPVQNTVKTATDLYYRETEKTPKAKKPRVTSQVKGDPSSIEVGLWCWGSWRRNITRPVLDRSTSKDQG